MSTGRGEDSAGPIQAVEVWTVDLGQPPDVAARLAAALSADERERAARMAAGDSWTVARAALRLVLAERLGTEPAGIVFALGPHGKPQLPGTRLRFNLSHSGRRALIALTHDAEVGVDVERTSRRSRAVERALTEGERAAIDGGDRHLQLLRIWCRKEALAKAHGGGLGWAPETFDTSHPQGHALADLDPGPGYVGALAVAAQAVAVELRALSL